MCMQNGFASALALVIDLCRMSMKAAVALGYMTGPSLHVSMLNYLLSSEEWTERSCALAKYSSLKARPEK